MKRLFSDGYIEMNKNGNTYLGKTAHEIMHIASDLSRKNNIEFNLCLKSMIKVFDNMVKTTVKEIK